MVMGARSYWGVTDLTTEKQPDVLWSVLLGPRLWGIGPLLPSGAPSQKLRGSLHTATWRTPGLGPGHPCLMKAWVAS